MKINNKETKFTINKARYNVNLEIDHILLESQRYFCYLFIFYSLYF